MTVKQFVVISIFLFMVLMGGIIYISLDHKEKINLSEEWVDPATLTKDEDHALEHFHENVQEIKQKDAKDTLSYFFSSLKNGDYFTAASIFNIEQYNDYFYTDVESMEEIEGRIHLFGETLTRNGQIKDVYFSDPLMNGATFEIEVNITFQDKKNLSHTFYLSKQREFHTGVDYWYIHQPVSKVLEAFNIVD